MKERNQDFPEQKYLNFQIKWAYQVPSTEWK